MGRGVLVELAAVVPSSELLAGAVDDDTADGYIGVFGGAVGLLEGNQHPGSVRLGHLFVWRLPQYRPPQVQMDAPLCRE